MLNRRDVLHKCVALDSVLIACQDSLEEGAATFQPQENTAVGPYKQSRGGPETWTSLTETFRKSSLCPISDLPHGARSSRELAMPYLGRFGIMFLVVFSAALARPAENSSLQSVMANDNQTPAGQLKNGVLNLQLDLRQGRWYPEDEGGGYRDVYAFAEVGHTPQISGPLIRVP
jgi:hypothetical protein